MTSPKRNRITLSDEDLHDRCDIENQCKNYNTKCAYCVREYDNEFEATDYFEPKN